MSPDSMRSILPQTPTALLVVKVQVSSARAVHLHMFQLLRTGLLFSMCMTIPAFQENVGGWGQPGQSAIITSRIMAYSSAGVSSIPSPTSASTSDSPCMENCGALSNDVYSPWSSGEYISLESLHLSESISGAQQL